MTAHNSMQNDQLQQGEITFKGIVQNTAGLSSLLMAEQDASQDYKKVIFSFLRKFYSICYLNKSFKILI